MRDAISYDYGPVPTIREFSRDDSLIRGLLGPFGSGKSSGCVVEILRRAMVQKPGADGVRRTRWACIRNSYPQLRDTTIKTFKDWVDFDLMGTWRERDHTFTMRFGDVEAEVMFRALDRPDDTSNLLSLELTGAWLNEAREIDWAIVQALLGRVGRFPAQKDGGCTWFGIIADTNPPDVDSWWFRLFEKDKPGNAAIFKQPSGVSEKAENALNLPDGYYKNLLSLNSEDWCKVHVHGEYGFVQDGKPVFPMFADSVHCTEKAEYVEGLKVYRGWDFGLTPAISLSHMTAEGRWIVFDELVAEDVGIDRFADRVVRTLEQKYPGARYVDVGDPAGQQRAQTDERSCFDLLYAKGIKISGGEQSLVIRVESIRKALNSMIDGKPQFALNPRCEVLRKGFLGKYRYRKLQTGADRFSEEPEKNAYSHCFVAGTPVLTAEGSMPIEDVTVGTWVVTPKGLREVTATMNSVSSDLVDLTFSNGAKLRCTKDHPFYALRGLVRADELRYDDVVQTIGEHGCVGVFTNRRNSTASSTTRSRRGTTSRMPVFTCTGPYGSAVLAPSLRNITSIIKTAIGRTTTLLTWSVCLPNGTPLTTAGIAHSRRNEPSTWREFDRWPLSGTAPLKAGSGTFCTPKASSETLKNGFVASAAKRMWERLATARNAIFAGKTVSKKHGGSVASITRNGAAKFAEAISSPTSTLGHEPAPYLVRRSFVAGASTVYDLTVDDAHCFYADGILVSNCMDSLQYVGTRLLGGALRTMVTEQRPDRYRRNRAVESGGWMSA